MLTNDQAEKVAEALLASERRTKKRASSPAFGKGTAVGALCGAVAGAAFGYFLLDTMMQSASVSIGAGVLFGAYADGDITKRGFTAFGLAMVLLAWAFSRNSIGTLGFGIGATGVGR